MIATSFIPIMKEMNGLKVRPCCIEVLEQVLKILKKHVSEDELQSSLKNDIQSSTSSAPKPSSSQQHYTAQTKNNNASNSGKGIPSISTGNSTSSIGIRSQSLKNIISVGFPFESHSHQDITLNTPSASSSSIKSRIPALSTSSMTIHSPPQSLLVVTNPPTKSSSQSLKVTLPSSSAVPSYQQGKAAQSFSQGTTLNMLRDESCPRNQFLYDNQVSSTPRKVLTVPKSMDSSKQKEVELVPGLGVKIPEAQLRRMQFNATSANDPAVLVIALLQHFFSDELLARSTATSCRGKGRAKHSTAKPLNQRIMQAIRQFSSTFAQKINRSLTETQVNRITANKIGTAKMALKRRQEEHNLSLHNPSRSKIKRQTSPTTNLTNTEEILNFSDDHLNFVIKVEKDEFNQPIS